MTGEGTQGEVGEGVRGDGEGGQGEVDEDEGSQGEVGKGMRRWCPAVMAVIRQGVCWRWVWTGEEQTLKRDALKEDPAASPSPKNGDLLL